MFDPYYVMLSVVIAILLNDISLLLSSYVMVLKAKNC